VRREPALAPARARELVAAFERLRLVVVGDVILDRYVWGGVERISPEAPVPVVLVTRESAMLGGAGNVARNVASLGAHAEFVAVAGDDEAATEIARLLADWKIGAQGLVVDAGRPTTVKTRVIARAQQVVRFDRESETPIDPGTSARLTEALRTALGQADGVILQDYGKGLFTAGLLQQIMRSAARAGRPVFVDPKTAHWELYRGAALVKPNLREAEELVGIRVRADGDLERLGREVLARTGAAMVAITRGDAGMTLFASDGSVTHVPTTPRAVADVAGAGDTAIAALALARLAGAGWSEAAHLANAAAGAVVEVPGTAAITREQLLDALGASA
jgi:D-beta-D-heptose 7-phosphate kinase/D-beta-D-heptose 1-phosphate adenosyltransferase